MMRDMCQIAAGYLPRRLAAFAVLAGATLLSACYPVSPEAAARMCEEQARLAERPRGNVYVGAVTDGRSTRPALGGELTVSSDWVRGRDPYRVYEDCVRSKSGQGPIRPLDLG